MAKCPRPDKTAHPSMKAASVATLTMWLKVEDIEQRVLLNPYQCVCGKFHVGRRRPEDR